MNNSKYSVWVGGAEVNSHYLTLEQAERVASQYSDMGYDDVQIEHVGIDAIGENEQ